MSVSADARVIELRDLDSSRVEDLVDCYGVVLVNIQSDRCIPGSHWGAPEAGLISNRLYARADTPAHSLLHELSHYVCMTPERRVLLDTNAGGSSDEESAVCYLQLLLADFLPPFGLARGMTDMDTWGYSFREGSTAAWFAGDGQCAQDWLLKRRLINAQNQPTWKLNDGEWG